MATKNTFVIEYGLTVGSTEVISSTGKLASTALSELDSDNLSEGSTNQYFTNARARGAISLASGETNLSYNSSNGELSLPTVNGGSF
jgi:hypothetical protein|tara:strand:- start:785 stop:1045 length:261 start_codon:yes stop_codon:yes gene_type:complete